MLSQSDVFEEFEHLLTAFPACLSTADSLESPNAEDNRFIKMAIAGFDRHDPAVNWAYGHFEVARSYLDETESLGDSDSIKLYSLLALGTLLGMYSAGKIDERVYNVCHATLPGFILLKLDFVEKLPS